MTCDESRALFSELADDRLSAADREACHAHLATCGECRREWEGFQRTLALLHALPRHRAPAGFADRVLAAARPEAWPKRLARRLFVPLHVKLPVEAAAIALVGIGAALMMRTPETQWALPDAPRPAYQAPASGVAPAPEPPPAPTVGAPAESKIESPAAPASRPPAVSSESDTSARQQVPAALESRREQEKTRDPAPAADQRRDAARGERVDKLSDSSGPGASHRPQAFKSARAPAVSRVAPGAVTGQLAIDERARAEGELAALFARVGAIEVSRVEARDGVVVEADVPGAQYAELVTGLAAIGTWTAETQPLSAAGHLRVRIRMVRRPVG